MFKVVPDQLRISEGWVRCGHCSDIFDAAAYLQSPLPSTSAPTGGDPLAGAGLAAAPAPPAEDAVPPSVLDGAPPAARVSAWASDSPLAHFLRRPSAPAQAHAAVSEEGAVAEETIAPESDAAAEVARLPDPAEPDAALPPQPSVDDADDDPSEGYELSSALLREMPATEGPDDQVFALAFPDLDAHPAEDEPDAGVGQAASPDPVAAAFGPLQRGDGDGGGGGGGGDDDLLTPEVSFVRAARRRAFWRRPAVRAGLLAFAAVFGAALLAQIGLHERDRIAAHAPWVKPLLQVLCAPPTCTIAAPRQIESIVIDSSAFNTVRTGDYQLSLTVKSLASTALAMPAFELSLTDSQGQVVVRRVLLPAALGAPAALATQGEWSASLPVAIAATPGGPLRVAGYSLLAFYP